MENGFYTFGNEKDFGKMTDLMDDDDEIVKRDEVVNRDDDVNPRLKDFKSGIDADKMTDGRKAQALSRRRHIAASASRARLSARITAPA